MIKSKDKYINVKIIKNLYDWERLLPRLLIGELVNLIIGKSLVKFGLEIFPGLSD